MYARLQTVRSLPATGREEKSRRLVDAVRTHPGFAGIFLATQLGGATGVCLTLWETRADAEAASDRTRAQLGQRPFPLVSDDVYEVIDWVRHGEPADSAAVVNLVWLDGPRSAEQQAADELSGTRIKAALRAVDGLVVDYVLRGRDGAMVVAAFARSVDGSRPAGARSRVVSCCRGRTPRCWPARTARCCAGSTRWPWHRCPFDHAPGKGTCAGAGRAESLRAGADPTA